MRQPIRSFDTKNMYFRFPSSVSQVPVFFPDHEASLPVIYDRLDVKGLS